MQTQRPKNSGIILILSVIIIASILGTLILFSNLITRELQQSRLIDQSIASYYLAESGAERALHQTRRREAVKPEDCPFIEPGSICVENPLDSEYGKCSLTFGAVACITKTDGDFGINGDWVIDVKNEEEVAINLAAGESFQLDLFSPYQGDSLTLINADTGLEADLHSFVVQSDIATSIFGELVNLTYLSSNNPTCAAVSNQPVTRGRVVIANEFNDGFVSGFEKGFIGQPNINSSCAYVLRISNTLVPNDELKLSNLDNLNLTVSIHEDASELEVTTENLSPSRIFIPSRLVIQSEAVFGNSLQRIEVRTPVRPPVSGLYDFVLFSEQEIIK